MSKTTAELKRIENLIIVERRTPASAEHAKYAFCEIEHGGSRWLFRGTLRGWQCEGCGTHVLTEDVYARQQRQQRSAAPAYVVRAPATPGAQPTVIAECDTLEDAREAAYGHSRGERWLRGTDVRIESQAGVLIEYAGLGR